MNDPDSGTEPTLPNEDRTEKAKWGDWRREDQELESENKSTPSTSRQGNPFMLQRSNQKIGAF